jgi:aldose 1-epimerase
MMVRVMEADEHRRKEAYLSRIDAVKPTAAIVVGRSLASDTVPVGMQPSRNRPAAGMAVLLLTAMAQPAFAQRYSARQTGDVVQLEDAASRTAVSVAVKVGNIAFELKVNDTNVLWWPFSSIDEFRAKPAMSAIPFLGPWANRLDEQAFYANGTRYAFDMSLGNVRGAIPIHGFLTTVSNWELVEAKADASSAWVTSRLEFYRQPAWMKQFPFAHTIDITYRLRNGELEVTTRLRNLSAEPMPVAIGFHPYFRLTDSPRDDWTVSVAARTHWLLAANKVPTGATEPIERLFPNPRRVTLRDFDLDDVFSDLVRDSSGRAALSVRGKSQTIDVRFGEHFRSAVVWAPKPAAPGQDRNFICFEPMAGITNAMNAAHKGLYKELQTIAAGGTWQESFWIRAAGF